MATLEENVLDLVIWMAQLVAHWLVSRKDPGSITSVVEARPPETV